MEQLTTAQNDLLKAQAKLLEAFDLLKGASTELRQVVIEAVILTQTTLADEGVDLESNPYYHPNKTSY